MRFCLPFLFLLPLAGCGPQVEAPPLTVRPIESQPVLLPAEASEPAVAADPSLAGALAKAVADAEAGERRFAGLRQAAEEAVRAAAGSAEGSERWTVAQQALTALVAARGPVREASAAVEALRLAPVNAGSGARTAVDAAAARIDALDEGQAAMVAALSARLG